MSLDTIAKEYLNLMICNIAKDIVISGPFKGMQLTREVSWPDGNIGTKVLGCYEQELHQFLEEEIIRLSLFERPCIVDIGCSEGYYAIGLARRLPKAIVWGFDNNKEALRITQIASELNDVKVIVDDNDIWGAMEFADLVICDCEGAELEYLDPGEYPGLKETTILVECHDFGRPITKTLTERFDETHEVELIAEGPRDPNQFEFLRTLPSLLRWLAVSEGRPCMMWWLIMKPRLK
jgi:hypothetical protein